MNKSNTPPQMKLIAGLMVALAKYAKDAKRKVTGSAFVEPPEGSKDPPTIVMYFSNEDGYYMVWFADEGKLHLYSNCDGEPRRVASVLVTEMDQLQIEIDKLRPILEKKNG